MTSTAQGTTPTSAHHAADGTFRNPWPDSTPHGFRDVLRWMMQRPRNSRVPTPAFGSFPTATPAFVSPRADVTTRTATWLGHSTALVQLGGRNILTDPMWSRRASPVHWAGPKRVMPPGMPIEALPPVDVVLLSHSHYDHLDKRSVQRIARDHPNAIWVVPLKLGAVIRAWGAREIVELDWWGEREVQGLTITAIPARHFSARGVGDRNRTLWCGYAVRSAEGSFYFAGDTAIHPEFAAIGERCGPFDLQLLPIGAYDPRWFMHVVHMDPEEAAESCVALAKAHGDVRRALTLAIHWGTFRLTDEAMDEPPVRARAAWEAQGIGADRLWVAAVGETRHW